MKVITDLEIMEEIFNKSSDLWELLQTVRLNNDDMKVLKQNLYNVMRYSMDMKRIYKKELE